MKKRIKLIIKGRVQAVGYRASCVTAAKKYQIVGSVRNTVNGDVFVDAEGNEEDLQDFISWCNKGPFWAKVTNIIETEDKCGGFTEFKIVY